MIYTLSKLKNDLTVNYSKNLEKPTKNVQWLYGIVSVTKITFFILNVQINTSGYHYLLNKSFSLTVLIINRLSFKSVPSVI